MILVNCTSLVFGENRSKTNITALCSSYTRFNFTVNAAFLSIARYFRQHLNAAPLAGLTDRSVGGAERQRMLSHTDAAPSRV